MQSYIQPSHPDRLRVLEGDQPFQSSAQSLIALPAGALFAKITTAIPVGDKRTYTSVATGRNSQIELNSDLVFCNHSCKPSLVFDMKRFEVRVVDDRPLEVGDDLTFFYPSTEWEMVQPFQCQCNAGASHCLGLISGASQIEPSVLHRYWLNDHIRQLVAEEREQVMESSAPSARLPVDDSVVGMA